MTVQVFGRRHHEHHVQPRAGGGRYLRRRLRRDPGLLRPVDGEQDRAGKVTAFFPHHEDRAVGMVDHGEGDAAHHGAPDGTHPPAAENHEPRPNLLGDAYDLRVRTASYSVNLGDLQVHLLYLFDLAFQQLAGRILRPLADVPPELRRHYPRLRPGERVGHGLHRDQVQLRTQPLRQRRGHPEGAFRLGGAVRGQQDPASEHTHVFLLAPTVMSFTG